MTVDWFEVLLFLEEIIASNKHILCYFMFDNNVFGTGEWHLLGAGDRWGHPRGSKLGKSRCEAM